MDIKEYIHVQKKIVPELFDLFENRYNILQTIQTHQPIGRRALANRLNIGERVVRTETNKLQDVNLIQILRQGMVLTEDGKEMIEKLQHVISEIRDLSSLEERLKKILSLERIIIVSGDVSNNPNVLDMIGDAAANYLKTILENGMTIGVTGGSSVSAVARMMPLLKFPNVSVIPARGGMGKDANNQANNIAAQLATKLGGTYELLHMPDDVEGEILQALRANPTIKRTLDKLKNLDILIYGVGRADIMAERRSLSQEKIMLLKEKHSVAEAFGHYFNKDGEVTYRSSSVGIGLNDFKKIPYVIAVAGGAEKAKAIKATSKIRRDLILVTDESAAKAIIEDNNLKEESK